MFSFAAIGTAIKLAASGVLGILKQIPLKVWLAIGAAIVIWLMGLAIYNRGKEAATAELLPKIAKAEKARDEALQRAADAEGRDIARAAALDRCVGQRVLMDQLTSAALAEREKQRAAAERALSSNRLELQRAYSSLSDRCADERVPEPVLRMLDAAIEADANADGGGSGPEVRSGPEGTDSQNPISATCWWDEQKDAGLDPGVVCGVARLQLRQEQDRSAGG
jgi:hypothetical protein